jgi:hypothetical protein
VFARRGRNEMDDHITIASALCSRRMDAAAGGVTAATITMMGMRSLSILSDTRPRSPYSITPKAKKEEPCSARCVPLLTTPRSPSANGQDSGCYNNNRRWAAAVTDQLSMFETRESKVYEENKAHSTTATIGGTDRCSKSGYRRLVVHD